MRDLKIVCLLLLYVLQFQWVRKFTPFDAFLDLPLLRKSSYLMCLWKIACFFSLEPPSLLWMFTTVYTHNYANLRAHYTFR